LGEGPAPCSFIAAINGSAPRSLITRGGPDWDTVGATLNRQEGLHL
jgi:hypothetical protein